MNIAFPGLLLRLADIMDFDASRAPDILFKHIGIEDETSIREWRKHQSVKGWNLQVNKDDPRFKCIARCQHPVHEKSVKDFLSDIDGELRAVRYELGIQCDRLSNEDRRFELYLPPQVERDVHPQGHPHNPIYIYEDIQFNLDQDEIQRLLLGQSLWGDPQLCIRELLQNGLDALQLRDLRDKMQKKEKPFEPVDLLKEELKVILTWGHDENSGQDYILLKDNGAGMTRDVILNYFTKIGKSFYRSADFERERKAAARIEGKPAVSPVSIFGIGILSCFMIGDRLEVRTRPGGSDDNERQAYDITISGPGSLFWLRKGTLPEQGTEVKVFLKKDYVIRHKHEGLRKRIMDAFLDPSTCKIEKDEEKRQIIDPPLVAASNVVWPLYPVEVHTPEGKKVIRIGEDFHSKWLMPIDRAKFFPKAHEWGCPEKYIGKPKWGSWKWEDPETGSRVCLWFPQNYRDRGNPNLPADPPEEMQLCRQDELAALVEPQLPENWRTAVIVKGMYVDDVKVCERELEIAHGVGCKVWVDLRGDDASPRLTADRKIALEPEKPEDSAGWRDAVHRMFERMREELECQIKNLSENCHAEQSEASQNNEILRCAQNDKGFGILKNLLSGFSWRQLPCVLIHREASGFSLHGAGRPKWGDRLEGINAVHWSTARLMQDLALARALARALDLARADTAFGDCLLSSFLQEAFWPDLSRSLPMFNCFHLKGRIGDGMITGPGLVEFDLEKDSTVHLTDRNGVLPKEVVERGYHLVFPMTAIPLGELRRNCPEWRTDRICRPLGVLPFLWPGSEDTRAKHSGAFLKLFKIKEIFAMMPRIQLWSNRFDRWTEEDWKTCGLSALWDIESGRGLWAEGAHHIEEMESVGKPVREFLRISY